VPDVVGHCEGGGNGMKPSSTFSLKVVEDIFMNPQILSLTDCPNELIVIGTPEHCRG
jgi:hypothetical protein